MIKTFHSFSCLAFLLATSLSLQAQDALSSETPQTKTEEIVTESPKALSGCPPLDYSAPNLLIEGENPLGNKTVSELKAFAFEKEEEASQALQNNKSEEALNLTLLATSALGEIYTQDPKNIENKLLASQAYSTLSNLFLRFNKPKKAVISSTFALKLICEQIQENTDQEESNIDAYTSRALVQEKLALLAPVKDYKNFAFHSVHTTAIYAVLLDKTKQTPDTPERHNLYKNLLRVMLARVERLNALKETDPLPKDLPLSKEQISQQVAKELSNGYTIYLQGKKEGTSFPASEERFLLTRLVKVLEKNGKAESAEKVRSLLHKVDPSVLVYEPKE